MYLKYSLLQLNWELHQSKVGGVKLSDTPCLQWNNHLLIFSHLSIYNGDLDGMVFDSLLLSTTFYDRRLVISKFNLHTAIGSTEADGWLNVGLFDSTLFTPQDNIHLYIYCSFCFTYRQKECTWFSFSFSEINIIVPNINWLKSAVKLFSTHKGQKMLFMDR